MGRLILNCEGVGLVMHELGRDLYGNDGTKSPNDCRGYEQSSLSTKILGILNRVFFYVGILNKVGMSYTYPSAKLARSRSARR
jgi:hypothetical protein